MFLLGGGLGTLPYQHLHRSKEWRKMREGRQDGEREGWWEGKLNQACIQDFSGGGDCQRLSLILRKFLIFLKGKIIEYYRNGLLLYITHSVMD